VTVKAIFQRYATQKNAAQAPQVCLRKRKTLRDFSRNATFRKPETFRFRKNFNVTISSDAQRPALRRGTLRCVLLAFRWKLALKAYTTM